MNYSRFITSISAARQPSVIRELTKILSSSSPDLVFLAGGLPNPALFPFKGASVKLRNGKELKLEGDEMNAALQYGPTQGYPPLVSQLKGITKLLHSPPNWSNTELFVTAGSQEGLCKSLEMMMNPGDYIALQEPCYSGTLSILLYIIPSASNPSGISLSKERRKSIYKIACEYNLIILEDDPYYFVQFDDIKNYPPTFLSMDTEGRVIRFDSFSKLLSSGIRIGYVTGPRTLLTRLSYHKQVSDLHASSLSQVLVSKLLKHWGVNGFLEHAKEVKNFYKNQRDIMLEAAKSHLKGLCEWNIPEGGMFLWMKVLDVKDTWDMILKRGLEKNVLLVPGKAFMTDSTKPCCYLRASFSMANTEKMNLGMKRLAELIREEMSSQ